MTQEHNKSRRMGQLAVFLCAVLWSTAGLFVKIINWDPFVIAGMRSLIAGLFMMAVRFLSPARRHSPFKLNYFWHGGIAYSITMLLFIIAIKLTTAANAVLLQYSAPVWAALLGWLLAKEKPRTVTWISLAMVTGGLCLFFKDGLEGGSFIGNLLALLSGITFGANSVLLRIQKKGDQADTILTAHFITVLASIPFLFLHPPAFTIQNSLSILFLGIVQLGMASFLFSYGIKYVTAAESMLTASIEPILNPVWVLLIIGEKPTMTAIIGGLIIVAAVLVSTLGFKKRKVYK